MAYKNDGYLVIANRYGSASGDAKSMLYETYDRLRDLAVAGSGSSGTGFEAAGGFLYQLASLFAPSAFMSTLGGTQSFNIPGTSYWSPYSGGTGTANGGYGAFGLSGLGNFSGFPSGAANIGWGLRSGSTTGGASSIDSLISGLRCKMALTMVPLPTPDEPDITNNFPFFIILFLFCHVTIKVLYSSIKKIAKSLL